MQLIEKRIRARLSVALALGAAALLLTTSCLGPDSKRTRRYKKSLLQKSLQDFESPGLVIGVYPLARNAILDGDTIRVGRLHTTLRLLAIDTEEIFHHPERQRLAEADFDGYLKKMARGRNKPVKTGTPVGVEAKEYADRFFRGVKTVRLERDTAKELRGRYGRYLVYVFVKKNGRWVNYNLECVRAGMSPYFTKYSYSRRFHEQFVAAQAEARKKKIGIWDPNKKHYRDYDLRLKWWNARADFIRAFEKEAKGKDNYIVLTNWDSLARLQKHMGRKVVVLGTVGRIKLGDKGPTKVWLSRRRGSDLPLIFFDKDVFGSSRISRYRGEFVRVTGTVSEWYNKWRKRSELQIQIGLPGDIQASDKVPYFGQWYPEKPRRR